MARYLGRKNLVVRSPSIDATINGVTREHGPTGLTFNISGSPGHPIMAWVGSERYGYSGMPKGEGARGIVPGCVVPCQIVTALSFGVHPFVVLLRPDIEHQTRDYTQGALWLRLGQGMGRAIVSARCCSPQRPLLPPHPLA